MDAVSTTPSFSSASLVDDILALLRRQGARTGRVLLGLTGPPAAGKSTLAHHLVAQINRVEGPETAAYLPLDGFHLSNQQLDRLGLRARKGATTTFDGLGYLALLRRVTNERFHDIYAPDFDRTLDEPVAARHVIHPHTRLVVTEGNYLANTETPWPEARALLHALWYVEADDDAREERLLQRHLASGDDPATARRRVSTNDHPNGEAVKALRATCDWVVRLDVLPG
ncbi:fructose transporter [Kitasatospora sp. MMS16-BH015]|uniref:nucleoside/nucleotide kinase family protein n=1 Tax=Kitasatospora sp. MMS16-BH015 TaxID=2018025 RepID=UPI000CA16C66|nr:nucleoside/nucleotide kinase family protein [Kitasatospora sp. MMS16-BH015]AUG77322.1 fructose transporter [Kitasatospora sp. MMS16-BH015]